MTTHQREKTKARNNEGSIFKKILKDGPSSTKRYHATEKEEYMNPAQLEYFKQKLLDWKAELERDSQVTKDHLKQENWNEADINDRATVEIET